MGKVTSGKYGEKGRRKAKGKSIKSKATGKSVGSKRRIAKMGKIQKAGHAGEMATFITRSQAVRRLQVSLRDFRRLCILRGIHPRDPKKKAQGSNKTYYHVKDIMHLKHEPLLDKFYEFKTFMKKVRKAVGRGQRKSAQTMWHNRPTYTLHHIVRERFPHFEDAIGDMEDALSMVHLFSNLSTDGFGKSKVTKTCERLVREWQNWVVHTHSLRKAFLSVKGLYYQVEVLGQKITWVTPYRFSQARPAQVDFRVMNTFLEFYETFLKFTFYKLYHDAGLHYPPKVQEDADGDAAHLSSIQLQTLQSAKQQALGQDAEAVKEAEKTAESDDDESSEDEEDLEVVQERLGTLPQKLKEITANASTRVVPSKKEAIEDSNIVPAEEVFKADTQAQALQQKQQELAVTTSLFRGLRFFLNRECPREAFEFLIKSFGGEVGWDGESSPFGYQDAAVTHCIVDRPKLNREKISGREYVQPQWVVDSINSRMLLPTKEYVHGATLPPHLSPFVDDEAEAYVPDYKLKLQELQVAAGVISKEEIAGAASKDEEVDEAKELAKIMMPSKKRKLHEHIMKKRQEKKDITNALNKKRKKIKEYAPRKVGRPSR